jgi:hypothetical protein
MALQKPGAAKNQYFQDKTPLSRHEASTSLLFE